MEIHISMGEWINALQQRMSNANDGDCFYLPTLMHLHAFLLLKERCFPCRDFKVEVDQDK
jgi:hypothetical protein